jgi:hypothetical protein
LGKQNLEDQSERRVTVGVLTDEMARLRGEVTELHSRLEAFVGNLRNGVMKAGFRKAHRQMARKTAAERAAFVADLAGKVAGLRKGFATDIKEFATDIAGAHQAWHGGTRAMAGGGRAAGRKSKPKARAEST